MEANWKELKKEFFDTGYVVLDGWIEPELVERTKQGRPPVRVYRHLRVREHRRLALPCQGRRIHRLIARDAGGGHQPLPLLEPPYARWAKRWWRLARGRHLYGRPPLTEILCMYYPQDVAEDMGRPCCCPAATGGSTRRRKPLS